MALNFRPMLGAPCADLALLRYPLLGSYKIDGVRAVKLGGVLLSRTLKPIPNRHLQKLAKAVVPDGYDGELIAGAPNSPKAFNNTTRAVMTEGGMPRVTFYVFDCVTWPDLPFVERESRLKSHGALVQRVPQVWLHDMDAASRFESEALAMGYEGVILRDPRAPYKFGRSTLGEQGLVKIKRFEDDEAVILGVEELQRNGNEATIDERGYTKRSSHQENKTGGGMLGALVVGWKGKTFNIGSGFTEADRKSLWFLRNSIVGQQVKFKYLKVGMKDLPRHPIFLGMRSEQDI